MCVCRGTIWLFSHELRNTRCVHNGIPCANSYGLSFAMKTRAQRFMADVFTSASAFLAPRLTLLRNASHSPLYLEMITLVRGGTTLFDGLTPRFSRFPDCSKNALPPGFRTIFSQRRPYVGFCLVVFGFNR